MARTFGISAFTVIPVTTLRTFLKQLRPFAYLCREAPQWNGTMPGLLVQARIVAIGSNAFCTMRVERFFDLLSDTLLARYCTKAAHTRFGCQVQISCGSEGKKSDHFHGMLFLPAVRVSIGSVTLRQRDEALELVFTSPTLRRPPTLSAAGGAVAVTFSCVSSGCRLSRSMSLQLLCLETDAELSVPVSPSLSILKVRRPEPTFEQGESATG